MFCKANLAHFILMQKQSTGRCMKCIHGCMKPITERDFKATDFIILLSGKTFNSIKSQSEAWQNQASGIILLKVSPPL